ncbi:DNA mismatch repair endonuclease MutL [Thermocrinis sp.]|uniref:DNA mismatch repair endonuclease MutL n=1 Tax=Thermocrinis sp. TaxID=2024383 RepID=UPI002FDCD900
MFVKQLPEDVRAKISAGEVIESPLDCVKELLENSLDAKASRVDIEIIKGGKRYISVRDDGLGIHPEDLPKVILPFTTSKLERFEDLMHISTYGFRGEALYSIAQVSKLIINSKFYREEKGYEMRVEGGKVISIKEKGMPVGTKVEVYELFYNLPARQRFLKKEDTEKARILRYVRDYAAAKPEVAFRMVSDGKEILNLPPAKDNKERLEDLYDTKFEERELERDGIRVRVLVSLSQRRGETKLFINSRPVQNRSLLEYLKRAVGNKRIAFCFLELPPFMLDINVHPKKADVRLIQEGKVKELLGELLKKQSVYIPSLAQEKYEYRTEPELVGIIEDTILVVKWMESLYFIDQHLLAERINYEMGFSSDKACKTAIKAGEKLSHAQINSLLKKWVELNNPHTCPHGRPLYYRIPLKEIYQQIGRTW